MINQLQKKVLILALYAGELMMKNGAEIYRVEDTITRICKACHIPYVEVFATTTGIFVSVDQGTEDSDMHTFIKRIKHISIDLEKISKINNFSRTFTTTALSVDDGLEMLKDIDKTAQFAFILRLIGASLIASFFTLMIGGSVMDFFSSLIIGVLSYSSTIIFQKAELNIFILDFCSCALVSLLAILFVNLGFGDNLNLIIIGSIMIFLPGVAITNAVRDSLSGDLLSGLTRGMEAFMVAISIAAGVGVVLKIFQITGGVI